MCEKLMPLYGLIDLSCGETGYSKSSIAKPPSTRKEETAMK